MHTPAKVLIKQQQQQQQQLGISILGYNQINL